MYIYSKKDDSTINPFEEINKRISNEEFDSFIYVVPTRRKVRYLNRELIEIAPNKAVPKLNLFTIGDLAEEIFKGQFYNKTKITSSVQFFLIKKLLSEYRNSFKFFTPKGSYISNGLVDLVIKVITRLKELGFSSEAFGEEIKNLEGYNKLKSEDIFLVYSEYQKLLTKLDLFETGDVYLYINQLKQEKVEEAFRNIFPFVDYLLITGFNEFTKPELKLIESLSKIDNLEMILTLDFHKDNEEIFGNLFATHDHLISIGFQPDDSNKFEKNTEFHQIIKTHLFNRNLDNKIHKGNIFKFTGFDARDEIETIAKIIKHKVIQNPEIDLSKICIAIKGIEDYSNLVREIFYKYGIPVNVTDRYYLKNASPIISIVRLLNLLRNDFFYEDLFYVLRSPYFDFINLSSDKIDIDNLRNTLELIKITKGRERILQLIDSRIEYLKKLSTEENQLKDLEITQLEKARKDFQEILDLLEPLKENQSPQEFVTRLLKVIKKLKVYEKVFDAEIPVDEDINLISFSKDIRALNLFESILDELIVTLEKLNEHRRIFSFEEFYDYITSSIFGSRFNIKERWGYGVLVTSPDEIRGLSYSILFLPGLENGIFPSPYKPLLFLEDKFIRNEKQKLLEERYLFYQCLNAFEDELYLSYPKQDDKKEKIISDFLLQLQKICDIQEFDKSELAQFVFSESEMFEKFSVDDLLNLNSNNRELIAKISKVNEVLSRIKLRMENSYQNEELAKEFCGIITDKELINKLYNKDHYFSITEIETFALCPFKYFINYIIEPEFEQEIEEDIQRNEFGIIVHQILCKFFKKLKSENRNFYEDLKNNKETLLNELKEIASEIIKIYERLNPFFFLTEELILGSDRRKSILEHFLELEEELIESDVLFIPTEFEKEFKEIFPINDEEIKLRGKIDRIDISEESKLFKVIDYKTGKTPERKDYLDNLSFQLPLYLLLVQKYFQSLNLNYKIYDAEFIKLAPTKKDGIKRSSFIKDYLKGSDIEESLKNVLKIVAELISKIREGQFNLTTIENFEKRVCGTCNYSSICRIDMIKKKQKN